jgi:hypothetical protein
MQQIRGDQMKAESRRAASNVLKVPHPKYVTYRMIKAGAANDLLQITDMFDTY